MNWIVWIGPLRLRLSLDKVKEIESVDQLVRNWASESWWSYPMDLSSLPEWSWGGWLLQSLLNAMCMLFSFSSYSSFSCYKISWLSNYVGKHTHFVWEASIAKWHKGLVSLKFTATTPFPHSPTWKKMYKPAMGISLYQLPTTSTVHLTFILLYSLSLFLTLSSSPITLSSEVALLPFVAIPPPVLLCP